MEKKTFKTSENDSSMYEDFSLMIGLYVSLSNNQQFYFEQKNLKENKQTAQLVKP